MIHLAAIWTAPCQQQVFRALLHAWYSLSNIPSNAPRRYPVDLLYLSDFLSICMPLPQFQLELITLSIYRVQGSVSRVLG